MMKMTLLFSQFRLLGFRDGFTIKWLKCQFPEPCLSMESHAHVYKMLLQIDIWFWM